MYLKINIQAVGNASEWINISWFSVVVVVRRTVVIFVEGVEEKTGNKSSFHGREPGGR